MAMIKNTQNVGPNRLNFSQSGRNSGSKHLFLALGANISGIWGSPEHTLLRAVRELAQSGLPPLRCSRFFRTRPLGGLPQPDFVNAVLMTRANLPPMAVLRLAKRLEWKAGRRPGRTAGPRPLDIDLIDYGGRRLGWPPAAYRRGKLILPHPEAHRRAFVLIPLAQIAPGWRHPVLGTTANTLITDLDPREMRHIRAKPLISRRSRAKTKQR
jgi:2-amino-4-hydroxy-6-hydroxymethyldihydropteridine diphosphokinase